MTPGSTTEVDVRTAALRHRARLTDVAFVAVTGSCGKTTTKDLVAHVLGGRLRGSRSEGSTNCGTDVARGLLAVRADDDFFVQELGAWGEGTLEPGIALVRPQVAVVTNLRNDHYSAFHGPTGAQAEKGKLVASLPVTGTAVLNWDDHLVRELAARTGARVVTFGRAAEADLRAVEVTARWPAPLSFVAVHGDWRVPVRTRLLGEHLLASALAALAVALVFGLTLAEAAAALATAEPTPRRMSPADGGDGVAFVRDDFKATADSIPEVLSFLRAASAARRIAVFGRISDFAGRSRRAYTAVAQEALASVDAVVFVGDRAAELWGEQRSGSVPDVGSGPGEIYVFASVAAAHDFLRGYLRAGDLVLLKGSGPADHLERILLARRHGVACWRRHCGRLHSCDECDLLR